MHGEKLDGGPETISLVGLANRFRNIHETMEDRAFCFVLGAGASRQSGIKLASEMVAEWMEDLHLESGSALPLAAWAGTSSLRIAKYDAKNPAAAYAELYHRRFGHDPARGFAYLESVMKEAEPSYGYSVLSRILATTRHRVVVTTNFDNLVTDALSIFTRTFPLVCGHESLTAFVRAQLRRPLVVKVHRDLLMDPKSTPAELASLPDAYARALDRIFGHYTPIIIGYGGNDGSLMEYLRSRPESSIPGGVYWCYWDQAGAPDVRIQEFVARQHGCLVPTAGFDELMLLLGERLSFDVPDQFVLDRARARAARIVEQAKDLKGKIVAPAAPAPTLEPTGPGNSRRGDEVPSSAAPLATSADTRAALEQAIGNTMQRSDGATRWWQWVEKATAEPTPDATERVYEEALKALPKAPLLLCSFANFLTEKRKDHDHAARCYEAALEADPNSAIVLGNFANFLWSIRRDYDRAQDLYERAVKADPKHALLLGNFAQFLGDIRKNYERAEELYERAVSIELHSAFNLRKFAGFMWGARKNYERAEELYERAIQADPTNSTCLADYAQFSSEVRNNHDRAEELYERAIQGDPQNSSSLGRFASFCWSVRKDYDRAELLYERALQADPNDAVNLGNFATFLTNVRKSYERAEELYARAIRADPNNAANLARFATFCSTRKQTADLAEELYERAIQTAPSDPTSLGCFATFLTDVRKDHERAEVLYERALVADPGNLVTLANFANFLTTIRKQYDRAEQLYARIVQLNPDSANDLGNFARCLLERAKLEAGLALLERAFRALKPGDPESLPAELWMYAYCHAAAAAQQKALRQLRLLLERGIRTGTWDFSGVIASARAAGHAQAQWLNQLAEVLAGRAEPASLRDWQAWNGAH